MTKDCALYDSIHMAFRIGKTMKNTKWTGGCQGLVPGGGGQDVEPQQMGE